MAALWRVVARDVLRDYLEATDARQLVAADAAVRPPATPLVSICIDLSRPDATSHGLAALTAGIVDRPVDVICSCASQDAAADLQNRFPFVRTVIVETGSLAQARNQLAQEARGSSLLFLAADCEVAGSFVAQVVALAHVDESAAAITGGMLIDHRGVVLETGIAYSDGSVRPLGRGTDPADPRWQTDHEALGFLDAPLLVRRTVFVSLGGFAPETGAWHVADLCLRARANAQDVRYHPALVAIDLSIAGVAREAPRVTDRAAAAFDERNRAVMERGVACGTGRKRILFLEDRVPHPRLGKGYPRSRALVQALVDLGYDVTLHPMRGPNDAPVSSYATLPRSVTVLKHVDVATFSRFLASDLQRYDVVIVARPYNMRLLRKSLTSARLPFPSRPAVIYDAEAIFALRDILDRQRNGDPLSPADASRRIDDEIRLTEGCAAVVSVSRIETACFRDRGVANVFTLGHAVEPEPTGRAFEDREGFLFVGSLVDPGSPNVDGLLWFLSDVLPLIDARLGRRVPLRIAGGVCDDVVDACARASVQPMGRVDDLGSCYDEARVFIAPARFAAGIPLKVLEAAAFGVPVVASDLLVEQLGWRDGTEVLAAATAADFAAQCVALHASQSAWRGIRERALERIATDASFASFRATLHGVVESTLGERR